jgi:hypothetical protein
MTETATIQGFTEGLHSPCAVGMICGWLAAIPSV